MLKKSIQKYATLAAMGLLLAGCGVEKEVLRISEEMKLSEVETQALRVCIREMKTGRKPTFTMSGKYMQMTRIPHEICGCTSKSIAAVFEPEEIKGGLPVFTVYASAVIKRRLPELEEVQVLDGVNPKKAVQTLWDSFTACTKEYQTANAEESKDLLIEVPDPTKPVVKEPRKKKKKKDQANTQANATP